RRNCSALADGAVPLHSELRGGAADGSAGDIFQHARAVDFSVARGNGVRSNLLEARWGPRRKKLVRRRTGGWPRNAGPAGNAPASCVRPDRAVAAPSPSCELEKARGRNVVDGPWLAAAAGAVGRAQRAESRPRAVSRAALRGNVWRRPADGILRLDANVDVSLSRRLSLHLEIAVAADRIEKCSFVRHGFAGGIFARRFPAGPLQPRAPHDARTRFRIRGAGAGTRGAPSDSNLRVGSHRARRGDVVHSADYAAALLRPAVAARGKLPQQSGGLRSHARLGAAQCCLCWNSSCRRVVLAHESWGVTDRDIHR